MQVVALQVQYSSNNCCNQNYKVNPSIPKLQGRYLIWGSEETQPGEHDGAWSERIHWKHLGLQATTTNKSVFTLLEWLETRHCCVPCCSSAIAAGHRPCSNSPIFPACRAHSSKPTACCCSSRQRQQTDRWTDAVPLHRLCHTLCKQWQQCSRLHHHPPLF